MRKLYCLLALLWLFAACQNDENFFDASMPMEDISFRAVGGGAVMTYKLPANPDIISIRVRYQDAQGNNMLKVGSYTTDTLLLNGFNEARKGISAQVTLCDKNDVESAPMYFTFDTEDSGPITFFEHLNVAGGWNGFQVSYDLPYDVDGLAHVFYIGKKLGTQISDTILMRTITLSKGSDTLSFELKQNSTTNTIVVRTEDFRGYRVKQEIFEDVPSYATEQMDISRCGFLDPEKLHIEDEEALLGVEYLYDGDLKGRNMSSDKYETFLAGPRALNKPLMIIDLKEQKQVAELRLYGMLNVRDNFPAAPNQYEPDVPKYGPVWGTIYFNKLPCKVSVYTSNTPDEESSWKRLGHFEQGRTIPNSERWCARCATAGMNFNVLTEDEIKTAEPAYISIFLPAPGELCRYVKIVVEDVFKNEWESSNQNPEEYVTLHELELFTKKN